MRGERSEVGSRPCKSRHRAGNTPIDISRCSLLWKIILAHTLIAECNDLAISLSCSNLGLLPRISGSQNCPTAPFMCPILPCAGAGALTHCDGSLPTPHTM